MEAARLTPDWKKAFEARVNRRDLEGAERIVEYVESLGQDEDGSLRDRFRRSLEEHRQALRLELDDIRSCVEDALARGYITVSERDDLANRLALIEKRLESIRRFHLEHASLAGIRQELETRKKGEIRKVLRRLEELDLGPDDPARQKIQSVAEMGDIVTANEYLERLRAGEPLLPEHGQTRENPFDSFFPACVNSIQAWLGQLAPSQVVYNIKKKRVSEAGLDMSGIQQAHANQAADMLTAWFGVKSQKALGHSDVVGILRGLGFNPQEVRVERTGDRLEVLVTTEPISDRTICPVPAFGSQAVGLYRIVCTWRFPDEDGLMSLVGETAYRQRPTLVFYFGRLDEKQRRNLARLCRERKRTFLVVDDILMVFLAAQPPGSRLHALFACTLPFTWLEPYFTSSGLVPPEMFYGRKTELTVLTDYRNPQCFVYGGRQLGKTALLREAARVFHHPQQGRIALWLDLKCEGLGHEREPAELWRILAREFKEFGVIPPTFPDPNPYAKGRVEEFISSVVEWLDADPERRILLLLDEADEFLQRDARTEFRESSRLKGIMDRTGRRLKVVLSGLHNVLRTTEQANHPLAHLGDPISVGPLLRNGEWHEARALIEIPMRSLGYRFESDDVVMLILAHTNYYPSLIQLYCQYLLRHLVDLRTGGIDYRSGPPYTITKRHVEEVHQSRNLSEAIRQRFRLTLQLDHRYDAIAYLMAFLYVTEDRSAAALSASEIQRRAQECWPAGFKGMADLEFATLLDEMVGLGVLARDDSGRYTLRGLNILRLLGTPEEIWAELFRERELREPFEPTVFRPRKRSSEDQHLRHPLTLSQEGALLEGRYGVTVIFGTRAAGMDDVVPFLRERVVDRRYLVEIADASSVGEFRRRLEGIERGSRATTLVVVHPNVPWGEGWILAALEWVGRLRSPERVVRVVFLADPGKAWVLTPHLAELRSKGAESLTLSPWHEGFLRQWLDDMNLTQDPDARRRIQEVTGNWPYLLYTLYKRTKTELPLWQEHLVGLESELKNPNVAPGYWSVFGLDVSEARSVLQLCAEHVGPSGEIEAEDLRVLAELAGMPFERVARAMAWAEVLGLAVALGGDRWEIDSVVRRILGG